MNALDDTIVAIATPPGVGAIAIVRVSGAQAMHYASRLFRGRALRHRVARYGTIVDERGGELDRGLVLLQEAPHSYTGEQTVEFHLHGSPVLARELVRALIASGARQAQPGEFTRRAFLHGKLDLHAAAAVAELIAAESRSQARAALANVAGGLGSEVRALRGQLSQILEELAASIDFPDEVPAPDAQRLRTRLAPLAGRLRELLRDGEVGRLVREGVGVAIVGPPNAGKSSLLNALLGEERALVSEEPGTTRDTIEERIAIDGVWVRLIDTAGVRAHADRVEAAGIERTRRALESARVALVVVDGSQSLDGAARSVLAQSQGRSRVLFANKADLGQAGARGLAGAIAGSVRDPATLQRLREAIAREGWGGERPDLERPHVAALYEFDAVREALAAIDRAERTLRANEPTDFIARELTDAYAALGRVSGETAGEELLDAIFARFCIGK